MTPEPQLPVLQHIAPGDQVVCSASFHLFLSLAQLRFNYVVCFTGLSVTSTILLCITSPVSLGRTPGSLSVIPVSSLQRGKYSTLQHQRFKHPFLFSLLF